jgi:hypothetical protein
MQSVDELLGQLRGVTGPELAPPPEPSAWLPWAIATIAAVVVYIFFWRRLRRPRPLLPPDVEALAELKKLPPMPTAAVLASCENIVRRYLERRHLVPARVLTPVELNGRIDEAWRDVLNALQQQRFAPAESLPDAWPRLIRQLESLIQEEGIGAPRP